MNKRASIIRIPFYKKLLSYFYPVTLRRSAGAVNDFLELLLYRNQLQLVTRDALYSDGNRYEPAVAAVKNIAAFMPSVNHVLVLGTGLASMVRVIQARGYAPQYTLVENDKTVLAWALELLDRDLAGKIRPICSDACVFISSDDHKYDLVFVDIFNGRVVPSFATTSAFFIQCRERLQANGRIVFNYIINDGDEWAQVQRNFSSVFPDCHALKMGINRILIATVNP